MRRDLELVRNLLLLIEENDDCNELDIPQEWNQKVIFYHLKILDQAGFVNNNTKTAGNKIFFLHASLTWKGHEFLDSIRNNHIWNKTKKGIKEKGLELGNVPLEIIKEYAKLQLKKFLA
ncbi:DUF2513 domain-containing protein [Ornithinibacillus gellani]|uniref:DUF2513 domain-containing protein n=1 Tax=Ornithinibacillus gellani TaxID=2293253 RepID=UPI000F4A1A42|nr:DUF2513 domain-containing protein [Ornithinibacillus gellani]TQS71141.1 DUF2513 domain-containing protein [Ornithinibacillus gellani]